MKYIEEKYQQLIKDIESAYDDTCDTLKYHINELKKTIAEKDEEIEKLKGVSQLQNEIDEYNRLEASRAKKSTKQKVKNERLERRKNEEK